MRSRLLPHGRHSADHAPARRGVRRLAHGALIVAVVGATGAYAATQGPDLTDTPIPAAAADDVVAEAAWTAPAPWLDAASRSRPRLAAPILISLTVDGATTTLATRADTIADVLESRGVELAPDDEISAPLDASPVDVRAVTVSRVTFEDVTLVQEIPHGNREVPDASMMSGQRALHTQGERGSERVVYRLRLVDGVEESREEVLRTRVAPVEHVVRVGTKVPPPPPAPARVAPRASSSRAPAPAPRPVFSGDARSIGRSMVAARGWGANQFTCLDRLWTKESNWNPYATNPSSGAYGIPQSLPASKMATAGGDWRTNPATQISWGLGYIAARYGTPCAAWAHSQAVNWY